MPSKTSTFRDFHFLNDRDHSDETMESFEAFVKFLHDNLDDNQINALSNAFVNHPKEILNGLNLALKRVDYKRSKYTDPQINALLGHNQLGGRPRIHS